MKTYHRALDLRKDFDAALALADVSGMNAPHQADWIYRFASWALDQPGNTQGWFSLDDRLLGWVVMQTPWWAIDCLVHPDAPAALYLEMLAWARARSVEMNALGIGRSTWFVSIADGCAARRHDLEAAGFFDVSNDAQNPWSKVLMRVDPLVGGAAVQAPDGLQIRPIDVQHEVPKYVALHRAAFDTENMTLDWRTATVVSSGYRNGVDMVAVDASGELVGFCVGWLRQLATGDLIGQIEPMGVRADHRGRGLGRALLRETLRRLGAAGAVRAYIESDRENAAAMGAYVSVGFTIEHQVRVYRLNPA